MNHFGGSVGGPIVRNKLFFFFDSEWVRIALPIVTATTVPTPAFQNYVLQQLPLGGTDSVTGRSISQHRSWCRSIRRCFHSTGIRAERLSRCSGVRSMWAELRPAIANDGNGCANRQSISHSSDDHEQVQTVRIDYNIDEKNTTWFRFQTDTGLQAAYTDPINPLFNAFSPQPLYSFAAGYTHVFSQNLVNYFNPAFSWYGSLFGPSDFQKTLSAFPIVLQGSGANAPFTTVGGLDNTWVQGRRASRFFINDNLAWSHGAHELRFGTNTRILRLNDYDFGEGSVPTVTYTTLPQYIYGVASTATETFPTSANEPFNFLNLDLYAQDTWKVTKKLTWTFGIRDTFNSNPLNPHEQIARLSGSFDSISHDVNQPLNAAIQTGLGNVFSSTPLAILQPRTAIAWQFEPNSVLRAGFGIFSDILPGSIADVVGVNPPYVKTFQGGLLGTVGGTAIAPGVPNSAVDATVAANQLHFRICAGPTFLRICTSESRNLPSSGRHHGGTGWKTPCAILHGVESWAGTRLGTTGSIHAQYVGTRAVNQPYLTQVNGYQTVCEGCFAPFPYAQPTDPRFGAVTQFSTGANSHYNGLQLTAMKRVGHGLMGQINYTWSRCMDTVSNGGFLQFSAGGILSPLPGDLARDYGPCDYDIRNNLNAQYVYQLPVKVRNRVLGHALNGWQVSGTVFWHSGIPFSVLSTPYSANGNGIVNGSGPQFASVVPGVPLYDTIRFRRHATGHGSMAQSRCFCLDRGPEYRAMLGRRQPAELSIREPGAQCARGPDFAWSDFYLTKWFPLWAQGLSFIYFPGPFTARSRKTTSATAAKHSFDFIRTRLDPPGLHPGQPGTRLL